MNHPTGPPAPPLPSAGVPHSLGTSDLGKTSTIKSVTNNSLQYALTIGYNKEYIKESVNIKFLHSQIDKHCNWKNCIHKMIPKLSSVLYSKTTVSY
jgi:hypothetical protein